MFMSITGWGHVVCESEKWASVFKTWPVKSVEIIIPDKTIINTRRRLKGSGHKGDSCLGNVRRLLSYDSSMGMGGKTGSACEPNICHNT